VPLETWITGFYCGGNLARLKLEKYRRLAEPGQFLSAFIQFFSRCQDELVSSEDYQQFAIFLAKELEEEKSALDEDTFKERAEAGRSAAGKSPAPTAPAKKSCAETRRGAERPYHRSR